MKREILTIKNSILYIASVFLLAVALFLYDGIFKETGGLELT